MEEGTGTPVDVDAECVLVVEKVVSDSAGVVSLGESGMFVNKLSTSSDIN